MNTNDYQRSALRTMADQNLIRERNYAGIDKKGDMQIISTRALTQLDNAARGMAGDVGEVNGCVQKCLEYGQQLDLVNLKEELGDVLWRIVQACDAVGFTLEEVMEANIAKLAKRYPDKYTDFLAAEENRDREGERQAISQLLQIGDPFPVQNGQGFAEPPEECEEIPSVECISKALEAGWYIGGMRNLTPPAGHRADGWAAIWYSVKVNGRDIEVPHWLRRVLKEDGINV